MKKSHWFILGFAVCIATIINVGMVRYPIGQPVPHDIYTAVSDPCDTALSFLELPDPNWIRDYGDNERTRIIHQVSKNRMLILRDEQIIAEISRRLIALEAWQKEQPPWIYSERKNEYLWYLGKIDPNNLCFGMPKDPNDPNEVVE